MQSGLERKASEVIGAKTKVVVLLQAAGPFSRESIPTKTVLLLPGNHEVS